MHIYATWVPLPTLPLLLGVGCWQREGTCLLNPDLAHLVSGGLDGAKKLMSVVDERLTPLGLLSADEEHSSS